MRNKIISYTPIVGLIHTIFNSGNTSYEGNVRLAYIACIIQYLSVVLLLIKSIEKLWN